MTGGLGCGAPRKQPPTKRLAQAKARYHAPYATWPNGLSSSMPGAMKSVFGLPVAFAAEHLAMVGELGKEVFVSTKSPAWLLTRWDGTEGSHTFEK